MGLGKYQVNLAHAFLQLDNDRLGTYNLWDCHATAKLALALEAELTRTHNRSFYYDDLLPLQSAVLAMQHRGLLLDRDAKASYRRRLRAELRDVDTYLGSVAPSEGFSPNSDTQVSRWIFGALGTGGLGLRPAKHTPTGRASVDQESLTRVLRDLRKMDEHARPILEALFHRSRLQTIDERYLDMEPGPDSKIRARVKMYGTKTYRFSYSEPALQQMPPECRHFFVADPGSQFIHVDYSQLEARLLAHLAHDDASIAVFLAGGDVHLANASDLLGVAKDQVDKGARNFAKTFLYGISYGGAAETMKTKTYCPCPRCRDKVPPTLELTRARIREAEDRWFARHPAVRRFQRDTAELVRRNHYYDHPFGVRRYFSKPWGPELDRELKNLPMQMGGAILMIRAQNRLHALGAPIVLQMHDAFMLEVPEVEVDYWAKEVRGVMEESVPQLGGVSLPVDVSIGCNWGDYSDENTGGLRVVAAGP